MDTQKLRAVIAAIKYKSLAKAAESFGYTPSAMTHIANSVENELGIKILKRTHSGVDLNEGGEQLYPKLLAMLELEDRIIKEAEAMSLGRDRQLKIGSYASIALYVLPELLKKFKHECPDIKISVTVESSFPLLLEESGFDIIFGESNPMRKSESFAFMKDRFVVVASDDIFPEKTSIEREDLYSQTLIMTNDKIMNTYFDIERFKEVVNFTSADDMSVLSMVREGMGIAVLPLLSVKRIEEGIRIIELEPEVYRTLVFAPNPIGISSYALSKFMRFLKENIDTR